jgi:hypothetical protein
VTKKGNNVGKQLQLVLDHIESGEVRESAGEGTKLTSASSSNGSVLASIRNAKYSTY